MNMNRKCQVFFKKIGSYLLLSIIAVIFVIPFYWAILTAISPPGSVMMLVKIEWLPKEIHLENFYKAWFKYVPMTLYLKNSLIIAFSVVFGTVITSASVGYAFSILRWPGSDILFLILLGTMMIPGQVTMIPLYILFFKIGWLNSFKPLIIPAYFGNPFFIFLFSQFFATLPRELFDAATVDGCSNYSIFWKIAIPLVKPALATVAVFSFMWTWNDFMGPLIYLRDTNKWTLSLGILNFQEQLYRTGETSINFTMLMAAALLVTLPLTILFFVAQKYFIQGIVLTGLKR